MKFNENLKYLRKEAKLTQEQLAEKLNVSRQAVTKWESGQSLPDIQNLKEMADMFGVTMDALVGDIGTKKESVMNKKINDIGYFIFVTRNLYFFIEDAPATSTSRIKNHGKNPATSHRKYGYPSTDLATLNPTEKAK